MTSTNIIEIDTNLLLDYTFFAEVNEDWNIEKYLNFNYDISAAIAFSKLYFPTFIEYKGCIILESRFNLSIFNDWFEDLKGNISEVEKMCNLYEIKDLFHINSEGTIDEINQLGNLLKKSWELNLTQLYPNRNMEVIIFEDDGNIYITLNSDAIK